MKRVALALVLSMLAVPASSGAHASLLASYRLPNGWILRPAGRQVITSRAPTGVAVSPDGSTVAAVTSGIFDETVAVFDATTFAETLSDAGDLWQGVAFDDGGNLYASGGSADRVWQYELAGPAAVGTRQHGLLPGEPNQAIPVTSYPGNMAFGEGTLYVAGSMSAPDGRCSAQTQGVCSLVSMIDLGDPAAASPPVRAVAVGRDAYGLALDAADHRLFVTNWGDGVTTGAPGTVSVVDTTAGTVTQTITVGHHPTGIALSPTGDELAVTNTSDDSLTMIPLTAGAPGTPTTADLRVSSSLPRGAQPIAVAFGPDGKIYVAEAGLNAVEVRAHDGAPIPHGDVPHTWIPTGWYPDALAIAPRPGGGTRLYVSNLKGNGSGPGFYPQVSLLTGSQTEGTVSAIDLDALDLDATTRTVVENDALSGAWSPPVPDPACAQRDDVICKVVSGTIDPHDLHVVVIFNENKTFDSYFGDDGALLHNARTAPAFTEYGRAVTTNHHLLAERYAVDDEFYTDGEASSGGHKWMSGGIDPEFDQLLWSREYDQGLRGDRGSGQYAGSLLAGGAQKNGTVGSIEQALQRPAKRIFDEVHAAGYGQAIYSDDVDAGTAYYPGGNGLSSSGDVAPLGYWGLGPEAISHKDLTFPDSDRAEMFLHGTTTSHAWNAIANDQPTPPPATFGQTISFNDADKARFTVDGWTAAYRACETQAGPAAAQCQNAMPNFVYMVMPENHTQVFDVSYNPLDPTPQSMVADNDYGVGKVIEGLSKSPFWNNTLVLLTQDDTQFVGDSVDIHRTFLLASGGLARALGPRGLVSHQPGSYPAMLKTIEEMFGLQPLTLFDALAAPMHSMVATSIPAETTPFKAVRPPVPFLGAPPQVPGS